MKRDEIMSLFRSLARSQGFYGRLVRNIESATPDEQEEFWQEMEAQNFTDVLDVILYIEC